MSETETKYWWYTPHPVSATKLDRDDPVAFEDLSDHWQVVVANAITRSGYPLDHNEPRGPSPVRYEGSTFDVGVGAVLATDPKKTPGGAGWREPLSLTATVEDGSFVVSVTNEADEPIPVHHYERPSPYFSILVAVSDDPKLLTHDGYDHMKALRTEDVVRIPSAEFWARKIYEPEKSTATRRRNTDSGTSSTDTGRTTDTHRPTDSDGPTDTPSPTATDDLPPIETLFERRRKSQITQLDPGQTLRESYGLPSDLPPESTVWLSLPIGGESTDVTGGREWTFTATTTLRA